MQPPVEQHVLPVEVVAVIVTAVFVHVFSHEPVTTTPLAYDHVFFINLI